MNAQEQSEGIKAPHNINLPVHNRIDASFGVGHRSIFKGRIATSTLYQGSFHWCDDCGGWIEGEPSRMEGGWQNAEGEHYCVTYHCRRCGGVIHDEC